MDKTSLFLAPCPTTLGHFSSMAAFRSSSRNTRKLSLYLILNIELLLIHIKVEFKVVILGVQRGSDILNG
jgi:hypothetical protein